MKRKDKRLLLFEIGLILFLLFNSFVFKITNQYILSAILAVVFVLMLIVFGFTNKPRRNDKDIFLNIFTFILLYYFITYLFGFFAGFYRTAYNTSIKGIIYNSMPVLMLIGTSELLRYEINTHIVNNKLYLFLSFLIFVLIDFTIMVTIYNVFVPMELTKMVCLVIFPSITKNLLLTYLNYNTTYLNNIFYRLLMEIPVFILPIFPDFGEYINIIIKTVLPVLIFMSINTLFGYFSARRITSSKYNRNKMIFYTGVTAMLITIIVLTSGNFKYQALTIGSSSMYPKIQKGDVVILKKVHRNKLHTIKKGDILVHRHENRLIVHRVIEIKTTPNSINFRTKGDNNGTKDAYMIKEEEVVGIVKFKIKYIGMPTVALNELLYG